MPVSRMYVRTSAIHRQLSKGKANSTHSVDSNMRFLPRGQFELCLLIVLVSPALTDLSKFDQIATFCNDNGWKEVSIKGEESETTEISKTLSKRLISSRQIKDMSECSDTKCIALVKRKSINEILLESSRNTVRTLIFIVQDIESEQLIEETIPKIHQFVAIFVQEELKVFSLISTERFTRPVLNKVSFQVDSLKATEDYNLKGNPVTAISLNFEPYISIFGCDSLGQGCQVWLSRL